MDIGSVELQKGMSFTIRPAAPDDAAAIGDVYASSFCELLRAMLGRSGAFVKAFMADLYRDGILRLDGTLVAETDGMIAGFITVRGMEDHPPPSPIRFWRALRRHMRFIPSLRAFAGSALMAAAFELRSPRTSIAYIETLAVSPRFRRLGVGRALLDSAICSVGRGGYRSVSLHVLARNAGAIALYEGCGFRAAEEPRFVPKVLNRLVGRPPVIYMECAAHTQNREETSPSRF
jgi:ribosomal protein S18 acetylase RimI-like enzyme